MRSVFICTALVICVSSEQPFVRFSENLNKVVPDHYKYDKENPHRSVDKVARGHKVEPRQPPLKPQPAVPWFKWVHEGRWAAQADRNSELHKVRARLLEQKLKPNQFAFRPHINPQIKPKLKPVGGNRVKRETESIEVKKEPDVKIRRKRDATISQVQPEIMKPQQEAAMLQHTDQLGRIVKDSEKRDKRHILYFINRPPQLMARIPRTTPNPFIRDTHIEEYDIIRPEVGEREGMIPTIETGSSDPGSYPLVNEDTPEFSKIISQFYLTASEEYWPEIQRFADNILRPLSQLTVKKEELIHALESVYDNQRATEGKDLLENYKTLEKEKEGVIRVKRRVNKTLKRKRAKKKKQRLRRFERKRLRMLTHARRLRRQQKSKQARLQRHYARMNMSTSETPDHLKNHTLTYNEDFQNKTNESTAEESEGDEEYESSEYEDDSEESEDSKTSKETSEVSNESEESEDSDEEESDNSESVSKPDDGTDDYEEYDESDEDYEDESSEESKKKKKKKFNTLVKGSRKQIQTKIRNMLSQRVSADAKGEKNRFSKGDAKVNNNRRFHHSYSVKNRIRLEGQFLHSDRTQLNK